MRTLHDKHFSGMSIRFQSWGSRADNAACPRRVESEAKNKDGSKRPSGSARSPAVMPGRNMAGTSVADSLSCSPPQLLGCVGLTLQSASVNCHTRSLCLATPFRSPPRLRPFGRLHEGSKFPACRFGSLPSLASGPFGSPLPASLRLCLAYAGPIHAAFPLPDADLDFPDRHSASAPL